jgi:hypothetical protein
MLGRETNPGIGESDGEVSSVPATNGYIWTVGRL